MEKWSWNMFLFSSIWGAPWGLQGMGSSAIRTRRLDPNTLVRFRIFSEKFLMLGPCWEQFSSIIWSLRGNNDFETWFNKGYPQDANNTLCPSLQAAPLACAVFSTGRNHLSKKQQQLLISESISEYVCWMCHSWVGPITLIVFPEICDKSTHYLLHKVSRVGHVQGQVIWHALGQGWANCICNHG